MPTRLHDLYATGGQSPWIDDLKRSYVSAGGLQKLIDVGIRGVTSNPTIMAHAIKGGSDYDEQFADLIADNPSVIDAYWELVLFDVIGALKLFRPLHDASQGGDGFVSIEVAPSLAHETAATIEAAKSLHERINEPNALVKIPATIEGVPAIEEMIATGHSINVTLIFSLERYEAVIEAYLHGLERLAAAGGDLSTVASVASFFVSRVDTEVDGRLEAIIASEAGSARAVRAGELRGRAAIAQARLAYGIFLERFSSPRFAALAAKGARTQRPLFASTSTKNPAYPDLYYVEGLIAPDSVDTMPDATVDAFLDHGKVARTADHDLPGAQAALDGLGEIGIDLETVSAKLEGDGVASFAASFDDLIVSLQDKASALGVRR